MRPAKPAPCIGIGVHERSYLDSSDDHLSAEFQMVRSPLSVRLIFVIIRLSLSSGRVVRLLEFGTHMGSGIQSDRALIALEVTENHKSTATTFTSPTKSVSISGLSP